MNEYLLQMIKEDCDKVWIGTDCPFPMDVINIEIAEGYRASSALHNSFSQVWFYQEDFSEIGQYSWKIVLDEMIRLVGDKGRLVIRMLKSETPSLTDVKHFLGRHLNIHCNIEFEYEENTGMYVTVYEILRRDIDIYRNHKWSFGILTMGTKEKNVVDFCRSVREIETVQGESEIIIMGPPNPKYEKYGVVYADWDSYKDCKYACISSKKNSIIRQAKNENVMIVHDRYVLRENFFKGFEQYGYDFDFLTVRQFNGDGSEFPSYACSAKQYNIEGSIMVNDYSKLYEGSYISGGLIIAKKRSIDKIGFNEMLFWNQMEDVELSQCFIDNSLIPRVNYISSMGVLEIRPGFLDSWVVYDDLGKDESDVGFVNKIETLRNLHDVFYVAKNSFSEKIKVVLYGAGYAGRRFQKKNSFTQWFDIVLWADKKYETMEDDNIVNPKRILEIEYDVVICATVHEDIASSMKSYLCGIGVPEDKIFVNRYLAEHGE